MREPEPQGPTGWALLHSTFGAPDPGQSRDHYTAVHVPRGPLWPGAQDTHTHRKSCLLLAHHTGLAGVHCTPAVAGRARLRVNIGLGLVCRTVGPSCPRSPITGWTWGQQVMGEHRVIPRRAGARSVLATWRVLLKGHRQVQVFLLADKAVRTVPWHPLQSHGHLRSGCAPERAVPPLELQGATPTEGAGLSGTYIC